MKNRTEIQTLAHNLCWDSLPSHFVRYFSKEARPHSEDL